MPTKIPGDSGPILLTTEEVSDLLGVQPATLKDWRWKGTGPPYAKLSGRRVRYRLSDLEDWIADQVRNGSTSSDGAGA